MKRRTILQHPLDLINLIVSVILAAVLAFLAMRPAPEAVVTVAPAITRPAGGATVGADELQAIEGTADPGVAHPANQPGMVGDGHIHTG